MRFVRAGLVTGLWAGAVMAPSGGCVRADLGEGRLYPVAGQVVYAGQSLPVGELAFYPDKDKGNTSRHVPRGAVGPDGRYTMATTTRPGALAGWYRVTVVAARDGTPPKGAENVMEPGTPWPVSIIPTRYGDAARSGLSVEVVPDPAPDAYNFVLTK